MRGGGKKKRYRCPNFSSSPSESGPAKGKGRKEKKEGEKPRKGGGRGGKGEETGQAFTFHHVLVLRASSPFCSYPRRSGTKEREEESPIACTVLLFARLALLRPKGG